MESQTWSLTLEPRIGALHWSPTTRLAKLPLAPSTVHCAVHCIVYCTMYSAVDSNVSPTVSKQPCAVPQSFPRSCGLGLHGSHMAPSQLPIASTRPKSVVHCVAHRRLYCGLYSGFVPVHLQCCTQHSSECGPCESHEPTVEPPIMHSRV